MRACIHVCLDPKGWLVKEDDGHMLRGYFYTQNEAVASAREVARRGGLELLVHGRYGEIQQHDHAGVRG
ncbi:MAG: DUF2188 domain-containing protein [Actinomycetota bacterium]